MPPLASQVERFRAIGSGRPGEGDPLFDEAPHDGWASLDGHRHRGLMAQPGTGLDSVLDVGP